jgi:hypothetical protein
VSVSELYFPWIGPHISWSRIGRPILEIYKSLTDLYECRNLKTEHYNSVLEIRRLHSAQFHFWEYINGNQTFMFDSHRPFICSVVPSLELL